MNSSQELFFIENIRQIQLALGTLINQCCAILIDHYATSGQKAVADHIREFKELFSSPTHYAKLMATAEYQLNAKSQRQNHKPSHLLDEAELAKLMIFLDHEFASTTGITSTGSFVQVRNVALAQVPLLNARRGSDAARLLRREGSPLVDRPAAAEQK